MAHCAGGPATDQFDSFDALVNWVEKGTAPDQLLAKAGPASPWAGRTRPLCPYPKVARYKGLRQPRGGGELPLRVGVQRIVRDETDGLRPGSRAVERFVCSARALTG